MFVEVNAKNFADEVLAPQGAVLVDFYGEHCMPCKLLRPILMQISREYKGLKLCLFNTDREPGETDAEFEEKFTLLASCQVMNLPTMLLFLNGELLTTLVGLHTKEELLEIFRKHNINLEPVIV